MMIKLGLWVGTPSLITFLASSYSALLENIIFLFLLSLVAMLVAILPPLLDADRKES